MIAISCEDISISFGAETILENVSFSINDGDKLGIVGVNGAGKSTLVKIISGEYAQNNGNVYISKDKTVGFLDQDVGFDSENTLIDEMYSAFPELIADEERLNELHEKIESGETDKSVITQYSSLHDSFLDRGGYEFRSRCRGMLINLGFEESFWDLSISSLSGGQKTRVALAKLLLSDPDIFILDEPTNHLDTKSLAWLEQYLKASRATIVVVSHDRYFMDVITNKILDIENGKAKLYDGNYSEFVVKKSADREVQMRHYINQQREIKRIEEIIEQQRRWGREKNIRTAESKQKMIDRMEKVERPEDLPDSIRMRFTTSGESGNDVLIFHNLSKSFPGKPLFSDLDLTVRKNERVFITGENGCGKSTLIKIIAGNETPDSGYVEYGYNVVIGYYDQENQNLNDEKTVIDELWDCEPGLTETEIRNALALFLFKGDDILKKVEVLSGGERARLTLAKLLMKKMNLLVLDEPTNHLDINSRETLEKAVSEFDGTVIAVSHDRYFVKKLSTRILDFNAVNDGEIFDYKGRYSEYIEYRDNYLVKSEIEEPKEISSGKLTYLENKKQQQDKRRHENAMKRTREHIDKIEAEIERLDKIMFGEEASNAELVAECFEKKEALELRLLRLYEKYDELGGEI